MPSYPGIRDYVPSLAAAVVGVSTAFLLFRRNPVASIVSYSGGNFNIIAASLVVGAPLFLLIATRRFPYPDKWALASLLGGGWAALFVGMNEGLGSAATEPPWVCWRFHTLETRMESWTNTTGQVGGIRLMRKLPRFGW